MIPIKTVDANCGKTYVEAQLTTGSGMAMTDIVRVSDNGTADLGLSTEIGTTGVWRYLMTVPVADMDYLCSFTNASGCDRMLLSVQDEVAEVDRKCSMIGGLVIAMK